MNDGFIKRLRYAMDYRQMRNIDIVEAIRRLGYSISTASISQYLSGRYTPKSDKIYIIAQALNVSPVWLIGIGDIKNIDGEAGTTEPLEIALLASFRNLNTDGKDLVLTVARYAESQDKFRKF